MGCEVKEVAYRKVASDLRRQIRSLAFPNGTALPTEAVLASDYAVSRQTVRRAFHELVAEGLVFRVPGRGTFATPADHRYLRQFGSVEDLMSLSVDSSMRVVRGLGSASDPAAATRLQLSDDHVVTATFVRLHDGRPFSYTRVCLPPPIAARLGEDCELSQAGALSQVTVIGLLDRVLPTAIQEAEQSISVAALPAEAAQGLAVPDQSPVLRVERTYYDTAAVPVELAVSHFHPDRYSYRVRLRRAVS